MPTNFRRKFSNETSLVLANPANATHTLKVNVQDGVKNVKGVSARFVRMECIEGLHSPITEGDKTVDETIALRVSLSGSNASVLLARWTQMKANVDAAIADGALTGFLPLSATFVVTA